jgi:hypothetical protein
MQTSELPLPQDCTTDCVEDVDPVGFRGGNDELGLAESVYQWLCQKLCSRAVSQAAEVKPKYRDAMQDKPAQGRQNRGSTPQS